MEELDNEVSKLAVAIYRVIFHLLSLLSIYSMFYYYTEKSMTGMVISGVLGLIGVYYLWSLDRTLKTAERMKMTLREYLEFKREEKKKK